MGAIELTASRKKEAFRLAGFAVLLAGTIFALAANDSSGGSPWALWFGLPLWLAGFLIFGWQFIKPPRLILDESGFKFTGTLRAPVKVAWRDVEQFFVWHSGRGNRFIAYTLKPEARSSSLLAKANHRIGADGMLPSVWPMSAESLAEQLNAVKAGGLKEMQL